MVSDINIYHHQLLEMPMYNNFFSRICFLIISLLLSSTVSAHTNSLNKNTVMSEGHPMALWHKASLNTSAPTILLLHGRTWSSLPDFDLQVTGEKLSLMDNLVALGFDVWALDARGYGETPRDESGWNNPNKAAKDVANVLIWLKNRQKKLPILFGWSYGSMTAQLVMQKHPELAKAVILYGYPLDPNITIPQQNAPTLPKKEINTAKNAASDFIIDGSISQLAIDAYVKASLEADPIRADWNFTEQWNQLDANKLNIPVLLLQGEHDPLAPAKVQARFFIDLPNANKQWVVLAGGDHAALLETPKFKLAQSITDFVYWLDK